MQLEPGSPAQWLAYARSDLGVARLDPPEDVLWETLAFHLQQAIEKALKAILIDRGIRFPRTHSIELLTQLLPCELAQPSQLSTAAELTEYGTTFRYPGQEEPVAEAQYHEALQTAEAVVAWAEAVIKKDNG